MWVVIVVILVLALIACLCYILILKRDLKEILKADRMKQVFLTNISHEIRVPLKAVLGLANIISKEDLYLSKNEKHNISDQMNYNANLIGTLINEVIIFTDVNEKGQQLRIESFSPNELCRRCLEANMYSIYHRQEVKLNFKRELNDEFFVESDRHLIELVLNKLILMSCRFTEEGEILVGCNTSEHTDSLTIYVADTGGGIPENRKKNMYTWFDNPEDMNDEAELDLSICQRVAQKLGGVLLLDDKYARRGTRMMLVLPLKH